MVGEREKWLASSFHVCLGSILVAEKEEESETNKTRGKRRNKKEEKKQKKGKRREQGKRGCENWKTRGKKETDKNRRKRRSALLPHFYIQFLFHCEETKLVLWVVGVSWSGEFFCLAAVSSIPRQYILLLPL